MHSTLAAGLLLAAATNALPAPKPQLLGNLVDGLADGVGNVADGVGDVVSGVVGGVSDGVGGILGGVADGVGGLFDALLGEGYEYGRRDDHYRAVQDAVNKAKVAEFVKRNPQIVGPILETLANGLGAFGLSGAADIVGSVKDGLTGGYGRDEDDWSSYFPDRKLVKRSPQIVGPILESVAGGLGAFGLDPAADIVDAVNDGLTGGYSDEDDYYRQVTKRSPQIVGPILESVAGGLGAFGLGPAADIVDAVSDGLTGGYSDEDDYYRQVTKRAVKDTVAKRSPQIISSLLEGLRDGLSFGNGDDSEEDASEGYAPIPYETLDPLPLDPLDPLDPLPAPSDTIPVESFGPLDSSFSSD